MGDSAGVKYLPGSYQTVGQDGQHYNSSLLDAPSNTAAPAQVVQSLYELSDHLPVRADFVVRISSPTATQISPADIASAAPAVQVVNPVGDWLDVVLGRDFADGVTLTLYSMQGAPVLRIKDPGGNGLLHHYIGNEVPPGLYVLVVESTDGARVVRKVFKR